VGLAPTLLFPALSHIELASTLQNDRKIHMV
jgi:hypothetical protein